MKTLQKLATVFFAMLLTVHASLQAQSKTLLIDFGSGGALSASPDVNGRHWNNFTESNYLLSNMNLRAADGSSSGASMRITGLYAGANANGTTMPDSATLGNLSLASATSDSFYVAKGNVLTVLLGNLPQSGLFRVTLFGSRDHTDVRTTRYEVIGQGSLIQSLGTSGPNLGLSPQPHANRSGICRFENIAPRADGTLQINISALAGDWGYLNALQVDLVNDASFLPPLGQVFVHGSFRENSTLQARYLLSNTPVTCQYTWETSSGPGAEPVTVSQNSSYSLTAADVGRFIRCRVTGFITSTPDTQIQTVSTQWFGPVRSSQFLSIYHIGNSLTRLTNIPMQLGQLSSNEGRPSLSGMQLADGRTIRFQWDNGLIGGAELSTGSRSREQIPTITWDIIILQPHSQEWQNTANINEFTEYARRFYQLSEYAGAQLYLYAYWPWQELPVTSQDQINTVFENVRKTISTNANRPALIIPAGQALRAVIEACGSGALTGYSRSSFYADYVHQTALGGYVTALTHYATIYKKSPVGLPASTLSAWAENQVVAIPPAVASRIQEIVWQVVQSYPNAGIGTTPTTPVTPPPVSPPPVVEPDPPFVTESASPSDQALLVYAFGSGPSGSLPVNANFPRPVSASAGTFAIEYTINPIAEGEGVVYTPHWSYDLKNWTLTQPTNTVISRTDNTVRIAWPNTSRWRFLRIHLAKPAQ